jgi:hypothetical protein
MRGGIHPGKSALLLQGPEAMIAKKAIIQIGDSVNELGDVWTKDVVLFAEVTGCCRWAPVRCVCCFRVRYRREHLDKCVGETVALFDVQ